MRLLSGIRSRTKRAEATTDESQLSASTWHNSLKWLQRSRSAAATPSKQFRHSELDNVDIQEINISDDLSMDYRMDLLLQTHPPPGGSQPGGTGDTGTRKTKNDYGNESQWHTHNLNILPTAYPLSRLNTTVISKARWVSLNMAASAALVEAPLKQFPTFANTQPRFRFGPQEEARMQKTEEEARDVPDHCSSMSEGSRAEIETQPVKYVFIFEDGKLVERELARWPRRKEMALEMRYKHSEPYAHNYGRMRARRVNATRPKYDRPIVLLPRRVIAENKRRLLARHAMKDTNEVMDVFRLPASVSMGDSELFKRHLLHLRLRYIKQTEERFANEEKMKAKANTSMSRS